MVQGLSLTHTTYNSIVVGRSFAALRAARMLLVHYFSAKALGNFSQGKQKLFQIKIIVSRSCPANAYLLAFITCITLGKIALHLGL